MSDWTDIDKRQNKISKQKKENGVVTKKKVGRPRKPGYTKDIFKIPISMQKIAIYMANDLGMNKSSFYCQAISDKIVREESAKKVKEKMLDDYKKAREGTPSLDEEESSNE